MLSYAVSVGVAVIPEGLVAVITVTMAFGVKRMAQQRAIVRKMVALEALGSVTHICSDKVVYQLYRHQLELDNIEIYTDLFES